MMTESNRQTALLRAAKQELGRFFQMFADGVKGLTMPSKLIDLVWHGMQKTEAYTSFCLENCGTLVQHAPIKGVGTVSWVKDYENRFGSLHPVWFMNENGRLDEQAYSEYEASGNWHRASWDCGPKE
ncbi:hypothetical protein SAMN05444392_11616 [Seinonella peptonophila]|uniref:Uncharacterized protein n=1 Tax=Seinonella peptonophila TaxID=112248 RepID=A0A1M5AUW3_9BACL|nr:hypothetical protein [Seinonella peptonophila]SHF34013.1 hypothetical protein SAMN05444392_11616 [Seinonella peptonophila]